MVFVHIILFLLTIGSTILIGGYLYSFAIMLILLSHEMGHYFMTRKYGVPSTLPFFIPFPIKPFGTLGAVIRMKGIISNKKALFDIGVAGPICGFVVALPFIISGMMMSKVQAVAGIHGGTPLGEPLLFMLIEQFIISDMPKHAVLVLHPFGYAGWVGLFVTGLNLLPVGQLDGGHVVYAVFGDKSRWVFRVFIAAICILAVFYNYSWFLLALLLLIFGRHHPPPLDTETELDGTRKIIAVIVLIIFILSFIPAPFPDLKFNIFQMLKKGGMSL